MNNILARYKSHSNPNISYEIRYSLDGQTLYCNCWQWKKHRTCKHLEDFKSKHITCGRDLGYVGVETEPVETTLEQLIHAEAQRLGR